MPQATGWRGAREALREGLFTGRPRPLLLQHWAAVMGLHEQVGNLTLTAMPWVRRDSENSIPVGRRQMTR